MRLDKGEGGGEVRIERAIVTEECVVVLLFLFLFLFLFFVYYLPPVNHVDVCRFKVPNPQKL